RSLGFARSTFRFAGPRGTISEIGQINGKRVATSYPVLVDHYLKDQGVNAQVVRLDGAIESTVKLGVADLVADVVETGNTLRAAGLEVFGDPILVSEAVLIRAPGQVKAGFDVMDRRLQGVQTARQY